MKKHPEKPHSDPDTNPRDQYKRHVEGSITVRGEVETHLPPNLIKKHDTEREEDAASEKKKFRVEIITLIVLGIYTFLTGWMVWLTRESLNNSVKQNQIDQRAWVSVTVDPNIPQQDNVEIFWPLHINNVGKTFASHIDGKFKATVLQKGEMPEFDYSLGHPHHNIYVGGIFPNEKLPDFSVRVVKYGPKEPTPILMTPELRKQLLTDKTAAIVVFGELEYNDIFGKRHKTTFCNGSGDALQLDGIKKCIDYNNADTN